MSPDDACFGQAIAVIGMAGRFPGARTLEEYWQVIVQGKDTITRGEALRANAPSGTHASDAGRYIPARGQLADVELFDPGFFDFTPAEAAQLDPQHRLWLELAYEALESAGYAHDQHNQVISVFAGSFISSYLYGHLLPTRSAVEEFLRMQHVHSMALMVQNDPSFLPSRTAYKLGLRGPAVNVQTACSTSLVAISMGVQSLLSMESDIVLAGGVCVALPQDYGYHHREGAIMSKDGTCRPFDSRASGTVFGNGGGAVVLKRLAEAERDGDPILAVLRGAAINNDGHNKVSYFAPSPTGQAEVITTALGLAEVSAETIGYVECHGTGTSMGDPIEVEGLTRAFRRPGAKNQFCCLGSAKGNLGHLDAAAGVAGFIRAVLALRHQTLPPTAHFASPNPAIDFAKSPFFVLSEARPWKTPGHPRRAGVSAFGIGGTNAHVILEEYTPPPPAPPTRNAAKTLRLSAKGSVALDQATADLQAYLERCSAQDPSSLDLDRLEATLTCRRQAYPRRRTIYVASTEDAVAALESRGRWDTGHVLGARAKLCFAFPGQGSLNRETLSELVANYPRLRTILEDISQIASPLVGFDVAELCRTARQRADIETDNAKMQVLLFCVSVALARTLGESGIKPDVLFGHSLGEWPAAHLSGQLGLEDALRGVFHRGRLMAETGPGAALSVQLSAADLGVLLPPGATLACVNGPSRCLVSGRPEAMTELSGILRARNVVFRPTPIGVAVHSPLMDGIIHPFAQVLSQLAWKAPSTPMLSSVTGDWFPDSPEDNRKYFSEQLRSQVRFDLLLQTLAMQPACLIIEVGIGNTLSALASRVLRDHNRFAAIPLVSVGKSSGESAYPLERIRGKLWTHGVDLGDKAPRRPMGLGDLPVYPFERIRCWVDPPAAGPSASSTGHAVPSESVPAHANTAECVATIVAELSGLPQASLDRHHLLSDLGFESLFLAELAERIATETGVLIDHSYLTYHGSIRELAAFIDRAMNVPVPTVGASTPTGGSSAAPEVTPVSQLGDVFHGLIRLREGDGRLPLFFIHGDRASELIQHHLPTEQTLYGYGHQGANGERIAIRTVEALAARCLEEWTAVNGDTPCVLAGHSFGALVAYHVAHLLRRRGVSVPHLYLFDGIHPRVFRHLYGFGLNWPFTMAKIAHERMKDLRDIGIAEAHLQRGERVPPDLRPLYTIACYEIALLHYFPPSLDVSTTLFQASPNRSDVPNNGFEPRDIASLRVISTHANHISMVRDERTFQPLAEILCTDLKRLRDGGGAAGNETARVSE